MHHWRIEYIFVDMSIIDEVLKDKKLEEVVYFLAERMMRRAREYSKAQFKKEKVDLTIDQWVILKRVSEEIGISQVEIASSTYKDPAAVTRILDILVRKGFVTRMSKLDDRRAFEIHLTKAGAELVNRVIPMAQETREKGLEGLTERELKVLNKALKKIHDNF